MGKINNLFTCCSRADLLGLWSLRFLQPVESFYWLWELEVVLLRVLEPLENSCSLGFEAEVSLRRLRKDNFLLDTTSIRI